MLAHNRSIRNNTSVFLHNKTQASAIKFQTYATATRKQVEELRDLLDPRNTNLYPSIVRLWFDELELSKYYVAPNFVLGKLYPCGEDPQWSLATRQPLSEMDWRHVGSILRSVDPGNQMLWYVSQQQVDVLQLPESFAVRSDDREYGEYIYDCFDQAACAGGRFEGMRRQVRSFFKQYGGALTVRVDSSPTADTLTHQSVMHLFDDWLHFGTDGSLDAHDEAEALKAFFDPRNHMFFYETVIIRLLYNDKLVGFSVSEILNDNYAINHFHKTNLNMSGISYYMFYTMMEILQQRDIQYLNFQEDVGIPGLRAFKEKMKPDFIDTRCRIEFLG